MIRAAAFALALAVGLGSAAAQRMVPVMVGEGADYDACSSLGRVVGLNPRGDNFLAVRAGPSVDFTMLDEVHTGDVLIVCESRGRWHGVVYAPGGRDHVTCGLTSPAPRQPYQGPCRSGWVFDAYVDIFAG